MIINNNRSPIYTKLFLGLIFLRLLKKYFFTPKPPKGGFMTYWISISPPWGI